MCIATIYIAIMVGYFIKDMPKTEKPRERFLEKGASSLSDSELLALVLRTGNKNIGVLGIANKLLSHFGSLKGISNATYEQLVQFEGINKAKVISLMGAFELSNRINHTIKPSKIKSPKDVFDYTRDLFIGESREKLVLISLDSRNNAISKDIVSKGTVNSTLIHPREIFRQALLRNAVSIILVHNHPSNDPNPSTEDILLTEEIAKAGKLFEHVVVTNNENCSLKALNLFNTGKFNREEVKK